MRSGGGKERRVGRLGPRGAWLGPNSRHGERCTVGARRRRHARAWELGLQHGSFQELHMYVRAMWILLHVGKRKLRGNCRCVF